MGAICIVAISELPMDQTLIHWSSFLYLGTLFGSGPDSSHECLPLFSSIKAKRRAYILGECQKHSGVHRYEFSSDVHDPHGV
jgi:hypothetical protein